VGALLCKRLRLAAARHDLREQVKQPALEGTRLVTKAPRSKALPTPTPETAPYWESCKQHELRIQYCNHRKEYYFYPRPLGFVGAGESGPFFEQMRTAPGGDFPLNTNGGGLSYTHTGMYGMFALQESIRQLRGEADAQVPNVKISIAHGVGGMFSASGTVIMTNQG